jgi:hypothetical protein
MAFCGFHNIPDYWEILGFEQNRNDYFVRNIGCNIVSTSLHFVSSSVWVGDNFSGILLSCWHKSHQQQQIDGDLCANCSSDFHHGHYKDNMVSVLWLLERLWDKVFILPVVHFNKFNMSVRGGLVNKRKR